MIRRWLYSTNHKDIGTLYIIFGAFGGILGTIMSMLIRMKFLTPGDHIFGGNYQLYNVVINDHAFLIIFLMVMSVLIGGYILHIIKKMMRRLNINLGDLFKFIVVYYKYVFFLVLLEGPTLYVNFFYKGLFLIEKVLCPINSVTLQLIVSLLWLIIVIIMQNFLYIHY